MKWPYNMETRRSTAVTCGVLYPNSHYSLAGDLFWVKSTNPSMKSDPQKLPHITPSIRRTTLTKVTVREYAMKMERKSDTWGIGWHGAVTRFNWFRGKAPCQGISYEEQLEQEKEPKGTNKINCAIRKNYPT
jgi:hypothetical protein